MDPSTADIHAKLDLLCGTTSSINETVKSLDAAVKVLVLDNASIRAELAAKDEKIQSLTDQVNRLDQASRSCSLRILGLNVTTLSPPSPIISAVYKEILIPTLSAASSAGDIPDMSAMPPPLPDNQCLRHPSQKKRNLFHCYCQTPVRTRPLHGI